MRLIPCPLQRNARRFPDHPAIIHGRQTLNYAEFERAVNRTARVLLVSGCKKQDRVGIAGPNSPEYLIMIFALWRIGAVSCFLNIRLPEKALVEQLRRTRCRYLVTTFPNLLNSRRISIPQWSLQEICRWELKPLAKVKTLKAEFSINQDLTIMFTSGSMDAPKAVLHTFGNHYYSARGSNENIPVESSDRWLLTLPLYHVGGLGILFRVLLGRATLVIHESGEDIAKSIKTYGITHVSLVATQLYRLLQNKSSTSVLRGLKAILLGGSAIPDALSKAAIRNRWPIFFSYGLTEMSSQVATTRFSDRAHPGRQGKILRYRRVRISDEGEILVKGATLFKGYVDGNKILKPFDKEGWFPTGDIGELVRGGDLRVTGRKDNMFISGGENIQPEEIEHYLLQLKEVENVLVVPVPDPEFGCRPAAFIKNIPGRTLDNKKIVRFLKRHLPKFKIPDHFFPWPERSDARAGKINRSSFMKLIPFV